MSPNFYSKQCQEWHALNSFYEKDKSDMLLTKREIKEGDWFLIDESLGYMEYYVSEVLSDEFIRLSRKGWLVFSGYIKKTKQVKENPYLGRGKRKWYWKYLPWREFICPFTKPVKTNE